MKRKIIKIDDDKCTGCGECIPDCPEGALQMIDGKARLVSDLFCDGLGACIKSCPSGAITVEEREAEAYDERQVMRNIIPKGLNTIKAHLRHLKEHGEEKYLSEAIETLKDEGVAVPDFEEKHHGHSCPGSRVMNLKREVSAEPASHADVESQLATWPVQLKLVNPNAQFFENADLVIAADCTAFAYGNFHQKFLKDKVLVILCPKLDPYVEEYIDKLSCIFKNHELKSVTIARMEVPCCGGINYIVQEAMKRAEKMIFVREYVISLQGEIL